MMYKIAFLMIGCTIIATVALSLFLNWATKQENKEHARKQEEIKKSLIPSWSLRNAMIINRENCNYTPGDVELGMGLYRTPEESEKYIEESLKRSLP